MSPVHRDSVSLLTEFCFLNLTRNDHGKLLLVLRMSWFQFVLHVYLTLSLDIT